jgi:GMP synthase (glutamine-hydrolysing)
MTGAYVEFVISEHPPALTALREQHFANLRQQLEALAGVPVRSRRYDEPAEFDGASAVVLSGSFEPWSVHSDVALAGLAERLRRYSGPVFGICAGMQLQVMFAGGSVGPRAQPKSGFDPVEILGDDRLWDGLGRSAVVYKHHADQVTAVPAEFRVLARSTDCPVEAIAAPGRRWWGTQFHPEHFTERHPEGARVLANFLSLAGLSPG